MTRAPDSLRTPNDDASVGPRSALKGALTWARHVAGSTDRRVRSAIDQRLHGRRRQRATAQVLALRPRSVLMICFGNICRSPFAAHALSQALRATTLEIGSAGFFGPDRRSPEAAQAAAAAFGIDLGTHRSSVITTAALRKHDLIVVMEAIQRTRLVIDHRVPRRRILILGDLDSEAIETRTIVDPYGGSPEAFALCYRRVQRCVESLAAILREASDAS